MINFNMLLAIVLCLGIAWLLGSFWFFILKIKEQEDFVYDAFLKVLSGIFTIIILYANYITGFNTVLNGLILILALFLFRNRKTDKMKYNLKFCFKKKYLKSLVLTLSIGVLFFFLQAMFFYNTPFNNLPQGDMNFYSMTIDFLTYNNVESFNSSIYLLLDGKNSPMPYHYSEFWMSALISKIFNVLSSEAYVIVTHSVFATILVLGLLALSRKISNSIVLQIFAILSIFIVGILLFNFLEQTSSYQLANGWNAKLIIVSVFLVWFSILLLNNNKFFYFPLLILPIISIACSPSVLSSLAVLALFFILFKKKSFFNPKHVLFDAIISGFIILMFYALNSGSGAGGEFDVNSIFYGLSIDKLKPLKIIAGSILILISLYILYFIPIIPAFLIKQNFKNYLKSIKFHLIFVFLFLGIGLVLWSLTNPIHDSMQFFYMPSILFLNLFIFIIWAKTFQFLKDQKANKKSKYLYFFSCCIACLLVFNIINLNKTPFYKFYKATNVYSEQYLNSLKQKFDAIPKDKAKIIAYISNRENLTEYWAARPSSMGGTNLEILTNNYYVTNLNCFITPLDEFDKLSKFRLESAMKSNLFYKFVKAKKLEEINENKISELQYEFIKDKNIKILFLSKNTQLPNIFENEVDTIVFDNLSGKSFVFLK